jgi:hypothetical protein
MTPVIGKTNGMARGAGGAAARETKTLIPGQPKGWPVSVAQSRQSWRRAQMCSSFSRFGHSAGAPISRSCACWFIGKAMTSRMFGSSASSMTMRSMPGAEPPCGGAPSGRR